MKKCIKTLFTATLLFGVIGLAASINTKQVTSVKADQEYTTPRGYSGQILLVSASDSNIFRDADVAIYCFNSGSDYAWSERVTYRMGGGTLRVMIPYKDGVSKTWAQFIVTRYDPCNEPSDFGWDGVFNKTADIGWSSLQYYQNTIIITGYDSNDNLTYEKNATYYYGCKAESHIYLDLTNFPEWEQYNAKFAFYFAYPSHTNESRWSQVYENGSYHSSFLWKVEGQTNEHLYEGIVPNIMTSGYNLWNMIIAVRFDPSATEPNWDDAWDQTQDLVFTFNNHNANIIRVNGWDSDGEILDPQYAIADDTRLGFFGTYFLDTVSCSGTGNSDVTTTEEWNKVKTAYNHLSRGLQGRVWTSSADKEGTLLEQAMARYDYIVLYKQYNHEDFINRADANSGADHSISNPVVINNIKDEDRMTLIIILASLMTLSVLTLIVLKKYKSRRR